MKILILSLLVVIISSCEGKNFDSTQELVTYVNEKDNGYLQQKVVGGVKFSLLLRPSDLIAAQEIEQSEKEANLDSLRDKYKQFLYLNLSFSKSNKEILSTLPATQAQFASLINELTFNMDEKIHLFDTKKDTFQMLDYIYPRMYGLSKNTSLLLIFDKNKISTTENLFLTIEEFGLNTGEVKFRIPADLLKKNLILRNL
tara:strand:- start:7807 stop:8406 length:600 start_codon:yes stop_codon:yes gene_type:complete